MSEPRHLASTDTLLDAAVEQAVQEYFDQEVAAGRVTYDPGTGIYTKKDDAP